MLVAVTGDAEGLEVFFVVPEANYEDDVPDGFPFSTIQDDPEDEQTLRQKTWAEWKDANHLHELVDGNYYIMSNSNDVNVLPSQWVPFYMAGSVSVVMSLPLQEEE